MTQAGMSRRSIFTIITIFTGAVNIVLTVHNGSKSAHNFHFVRSPSNESHIASPTFRSIVLWLFGVVLWLFGVRTMTSEPLGLCKLLKILHLSLWHGRGHQFDPARCITQTAVEPRKRTPLRLHVQSRKLFYAIRTDASPA